MLQDKQSLWVYLGAVLDVVSLLEAEVTEIVGWRHTPRQSLQSHLLQLQHQAQNFIQVLQHIICSAVMSPCNSVSAPSPVRKQVWCSWEGGSD